MKKVAIILLNWNNYFDTKECIDSLKKIDYENHEIIVVDNGSKSDVVRLEKESGITLIKNEKNLGFAEGNNVGIRYALKNGAEYILLLNNDTVVNHTFLTRLVTEAEKDEKIGIASPILYFFDRKDRVWYGGAKFNFFHGDARHKKLNKKDKGKYKVEKTGYGSGAAFLIKKEVIDKIGLLCSDYFIYYEEADWSIRAKRAGYDIIFVPQSKVWHKVSSSTKKASPFMIEYNIRNRMIFMKRNAHFYHWPTFLFFYYFEFTIFVLFKLLLLNFSAVKAAFKGLNRGFRY